MIKHNIVPSDGDIISLTYVKDELQYLQNDLKTVNDNLSREFSHSKLRMKIINSSMHLFINLKRILSNRFNTPSISTDWIRTIEICKTTPKMFESKSLTFYDDRGFPGGCTLAFYHYCRTVYPNINLNWYLGGCEKVIDDSSEISRAYPYQCIIVDTTTEEGRQVLRKRIPRIDVYFSFKSTVEYGNEYCNQEILHYKPLIGTIASCLSLLNKGGNAVFKQYTIHTMTTFSIISLLKKVFSEVSIRRLKCCYGNMSESYIVCIGYIGISKAHNELIALYNISSKFEAFTISPSRNVMDIIKGFYLETTRPLHAYIDKVYILSILKAANLTTKEQINSMLETIKIHRETQHYTEDNIRDIVMALTEQRELEWLNQINLQLLHEDLKLKVKNISYRKDIRR
jgi:hypothetical protein